MSSSWRGIREEGGMGMERGSITVRETMMSVAEEIGIIIEITDTGITEDHRIMMVMEGMRRITVLLVDV